MRTVIIIRTCHRSSRSSRRGKRPSPARRQKLSKADRATSSSSAIRRAAPWRHARARATSREKSALPQFLGGGAIAALQLVEPARDLSLGRHHFAFLPLGFSRPASPARKILRLSWECRTPNDGASNSPPTLPHLFFSQADDGFSPPLGSNPPTGLTPRRNLTNKKDLSWPDRFSRLCLSG